MYNGCINVFKEKGYTSFDVIAKLRGILKQKKIGHTGTLDPQAEGVLPVCLGSGTKLCGMLTDQDKIYRAELVLGMATDTQDITGTVLQRADWLPDASAVRSTIASFQGEYDQIPPMYSAIKIGGKKLYQLAREGKTVDRPARRVEIYRIEILEEAIPVITIRVHCSKGTYIRTLCHDIGEKLGCGACMGSLLREKVGRFRLEDALTLGQIQEKAEDGSLSSVVTAPDALFSDYPAAVTEPQWDRLAQNGNAVTTDMIRFEGMMPERIRLYDSAKRFVGIYMWKDALNCYKPEKMFWGNE